MLPALARFAIEAYTDPGELVLDPMCGIGTTLVEAAHLGRRALGVEFETRWAALATRNLGHARAQGAPGEARVIEGDARRMLSLVPPACRDAVALVLTSPPYGDSLHGRVRTDGGVVEKYDTRYSDDRSNLAHLGWDRLLAGTGEILAAARQMVRPGGFLVLTARPFRRAGRLLDLPGALVEVAVGAGFDLYERNVALLAALDGDGFRARASFFQLHEARRARAGGEARFVIAHEDVLVFRAAKPRRSPGGGGGAGVHR
jgi:SAM-dependent methyltransferase